MRRLASALFTLLVAATPALAQSYPDQPYPYEPSVDIDASIYIDVNIAPIGDEVPDVAVFYDRLSPYGTWLDDATYGYVFAPADIHYVPYSNGYWRLTDFGWTWIAADPHGWATSHYGRWVWRDRWVWRPDTTWGPAWVQWRESANVVGWAPLGYDIDAYIPEANWRFIPTVYITSTEVSRYYVRTDVARYVRDTRPIVRWNRHNDRRWVAGPDRAYLERNKVRVQRVAYQPREVGRFDAAERRQLEQRAAEAKVKYRARVTRDAQVRTQLETKRATVERKQVEQQRERARSQVRVKEQAKQQERQTEQRQRTEQAKEAQQRQRVEQAKQVQQRQTEQRQRAEQAKEAQQRQRAEQAKEAQQRQTEQRQRAEQAKQRQTEIVEKQKTDQREKQQRARQQVEERKLQDKQHEQNERRQLEDKKKQQQADQRRAQPPQKQRVEPQRNEPQKAPAEERRQSSPPARDKKDDRKK